ncbi:hypothetical protein Celaphus_00002420, partial [Cervus elaphus hippelaphus]
QSSESRFLNPRPPRLLALPPAFDALESDLCRHEGDPAGTRTKTQSNETRPGLPGSKAQGQYQRLGPCISPGRRLSLTTPLPPVRDTESPEFAEALVPSSSCSASSRCTLYHHYSGEVFRNSFPPRE